MRRSSAPQSSERTNPPTGQLSSTSCDNMNRDLGKQYRDFEDVPSLHNVVLEHFKEEKALERASDWAASKRVAAVSVLFFLGMIALSLLTSCTPPPPVVSGDTYCERARHISADERQRGVIIKDESLWRSLVKQIADNNDTYAINCIIPDIIKE